MSIYKTDGAHKGPFGMVTVAFPPEPDVDLIPDNHSSTVTWPNAFSGTQKDPGVTWRRWAATHDPMYTQQFRTQIVFFYYE